MGQSLTTSHNVGPVTTTPTNASVTPTPTGTRRLDIRITASGRKLIADRAAAADVTPSHMVRRMLAYANEHMPTRYTPPRSTRRKDAKLRVCIPARAYKLVADRAAAADVTPSHFARRMLAYAARHMPTDWLPGRPTRTAR